MESIYVGNLPWTITEDEIRSLLSSYGEVGEINIIQNKETGRSKGYGFIEVEDAETVIGDLNGKEYGGRSLKVSSALQKEKRSFQPRQNANNSPYASSSYREAGGEFSNTKVYVGNLPWDVTREELQKLFSAYGEVKAVQLPQDPETGRPKGFGFIDVDNSKDLLRQATEITLRDRKLKLRPAKNKPNHR